MRTVRAMGILAAVAVACLGVLTSEIQAQDFCFDPAVNYAAGDGPTSVFAADLDGDNDTDLVVANHWSHNVSVLKNNGFGTFAAPVNYAVGFNPVSVFAANLDGDGDADLAVACDFGGIVSVLKNNGNGTFAAAVNYAAGTSPRSIFAADLDGDGDADLAVANCGGNNVSVLKNNGNGTFAAAINYAAGDCPSSVFAVDLDGDNDADLAVANWNSSNVSVLKNNGNAIFAAPVNYPAGGYPSSVYAADLDGDNDADLAVANYLSDNVSVLKNNGDGTFAAAVNYAAGDGPQEVFAAYLDCDGDNDPDLAVANSLSDNVSVLKNNGNGTFAAAMNYAAGDGPQSVFAADFDRDHDADLAVANENSDNVSVLLNCCTCFSTGNVNGDPFSLTVADYVALVKFVNFMGSPPTPLYQGDLNGDGYIDQADLDLYNCYFIYGMSCFPQFPIPVPCYPDTTRGCCMTGAGNFVRSPANCVLLGGTYVGNGIPCPCYAVPKSTALWLPFDEGVPGPSMNGAAPYDGTQNGSLVAVSGEVNGALQFDGATAYIDVPSYSDINPGTGDFSLDAWVTRSPGDAGVRVIADKRSNVGGYFGYEFFLLDGRLGCQIAAGTYNNWATTEVVPATGWHHVALTVERGSAIGGRFYIDGQPTVATFDPRGYSGSLSSNAPFRVGAVSYSGSSKFLGGIDEVEMFRRALTPAEVQALFDAQNVGKCRCYCPHQGDMDGSGYIDVQDILAVIKVAFLNGPDVQDPMCPKTRADVNNSGFVDVNDVLYIIKTAFINGPDPIDPCNP